MAKRVLSVGQCMADHSGISWMIRQHFDAEVVPAGGTADALQQLRRQAFDLILVNRVLDRDRSSGLDVIRQIKEDEELQKVPVMLVSNYADAQDRALQLGAVPGFGKSALGEPEVVERLREFLA
jgi:two-component system chemotaxis response regulator CheY